MSRRATTAANVTARTITINSTPKGHHVSSTTPSSQELIAAAIAEKFTEPTTPRFSHGRPVYDNDGNQIFDPVPMAERTGRPPSVVFTAGDGHLSVRGATAAEIAEAITPTLDALVEKKLRQLATTAHADRDDLGDDLYRCAGTTLTPLEPDSAAYLASQVVLPWLNRLTGLRQETPAPTS